MNHKVSAMGQFQLFHLLLQPMNEGVQNALTFFCCANPFGDWAKCVLMRAPVSLHQSDRY